MNIYVDCEFNSFGGELISMALVADDGEQWYEVLPVDNPHPWVQEHVMPVLSKGPIPKKSFQRSLENFLSRYEAVHIVADWPEDVVHFCRALITGPGMRLDTPLLTMEVRRDLDAESRIPHNALADAIAIQKKAHSLAATTGPIS